jgi:hypothetical protein
MEKAKNAWVVMLLMLASCSDSPGVKTIKEIEKSVKINDVQKYDRYYYIENNIAHGIYLITRTCRHS